MATYERGAWIARNSGGLYAYSKECGIVWRIGWKSGVGGGRDMKL